MRALASTHLAILLVAMCACEKDEARSREAPRAVASMAALRIDASAIEVPLDPPAPPGDLRAEIDAFGTLDGCVAQHAQVDPILGDALHGIGYDTFIRDACRLLEGAKMKDPKRCEAIDASSLRAVCVTLAAVVSNDPDMCPWDIPMRPALGRDPVCLAYASHDARLCAAADSIRRPACEAVTRRDAKKCEQAVASGEQALCIREAERWSSVVPGSDAARPTLARPWAALALKPLEGTSDLVQAEVDLADVLARGVAVVDQRDGLHFDVGTLRETAPTHYGNVPNARPHIGLSVIVAASGREVKVERCELGIPGAIPLVSPGAPCALKGSVTKIDKTRGGDVKITFDGEIGASPHGYKVHFDFATFVRDVVKPSALAGMLVPSTPQRVGDAGR